MSGMLQIQSEQTRNLLLWLLSTRYLRFLSCGMHIMVVDAEAASGFAINGLINMFHKALLCKISTCVMDSLLGFSN